MANNWTNQILQSFIYGGQINPVYSVPRVRQYVIGLNGIPDCDFNFAADAATHDPQVLDMGLIIPYQWNLEFIIVECIEAVAGVANFGIAAGKAPACLCLPYVLLPGLGDTTTSGHLPRDANDTIRHFYFLGDPTSLTWDDMTAGQWLVTLLFNDYSQI